MHHFTFSRIKRASLYKVHGDSDCQLNADLADSVEHWYDDQGSGFNINTVERMEEFQKLNTDLMSILDEYFSTNIWTD